MKKLFAFVLCSLFLSSFLPAQPLPGPELLLREYSEYSKIIRGQVPAKRVQFKLNTVKKSYTTREQNEMEIAELEDMALYGEAPIDWAEETQVTDTYNEVTISIPEGYSINKYILIDSFYQDLYFPFVTARSILIRSNDKDISFKLDYDLKLTNQDKIKEIPTEYTNQAITMTVRFAPKYFTLRRDYDNNYKKKVKVNYKGQEITLDVEVYPFLVITTPEGKDMTYVLEPNFQNLYNDFKFVREGHSPIYYRDIR